MTAEDLTPAACQGRVLLDPAAREADILVDELSARISDLLRFRPRIELVPAGSLGRSVHKTSLLEESAMTDPADVANPAPRGSQILANAARLFSERGFGQASMRDLAAVNDLSLAGLYHYFPSKGAILAAIVDEAIDHLLLAIRDAVAGSDTPEDRIRAVFRALVETVVRHREAVHTLLREHRQTHPRASADRADEAARGQPCCFELNCARWIVAERSSDVDPSVAVFSLIGMTNWTYFWYREDGLSHPSKSRPTWPTSSCTE